MKHTTGKKPYPATHPKPGRRVSGDRQPHRSGGRNDSRRPIRSVAVLGGGDRPDELFSSSVKLFDFSFKERLLPLVLLLL